MPVLRSFVTPGLHARCPTWLLLSIIVVLGLPAADDWGMRWRIYNDTVAGVTFRYPYDYRTGNQYKGDLMRRERLDQPTEENDIQVIEIDGKKVRVRLNGNDAPRSGPDVRTFSLKAAEVESLKAGSDLGAIGDALSRKKLNWKTYDYYAESTARPFGSKKWAMKDFTAMVGENATTCAIIVKHADRHSGLILTGKFESADNQAIIDTFEVLQPGKGKNPATSWREAQARAGKVFDAQGQPVSRGGKGTVSWKDGWDLETAHYHITAHGAPGRLLQHAQYLESLYKGYVGIYEPDAVPPYKFEIHIFNTHQDFMAAATAHGFPVPESVVGFFLPHLQSIFVYEDSLKSAGEDYSVEHVLAHECSHQFLHMACNGTRHVPTWLNEGLAVYFEAGVVQGGQFVERTPKGRIEYLKQIYDRTKTTIFPVEQYLAHYDHIAAAQYGEVYAMTYFWLFGTCEADCKHKAGECGRAHFRDYWQRLKEGEDGTKAFDATFMAGLIKSKGSREAAITAWQNAYFTYVKRVMR